MACQCLFAACILQLFLIVLFLGRNRPGTQPSTDIVMTITRNDRPSSLTTTNRTKSVGNPEGVAICLFLHSPTWFQRRYTMNVRNIKDNIPSNWAVQIFYTAKGQSQNALEINPGLRRMIDTGEVTLTLIPEAILEKKKKYFEMWTEKFIWENALADRVLVFGGNQVICGNSIHSLSTFDQWDYIGGPWSQFSGQGGDGLISLRNRRAMIDVIEYELAKVPEAKRANAFKNWGQEDMFFVSRMLEMNKLKLREFNVASRESTLIFGALGGEANPNVLTASGTLLQMAYDDREKFLAVCPELKMLFPQLHDPNCFGADPDSVKCAQSICALQESHRGGCPAIIK